MWLAADERLFENWKVENVGGFDDQRLGFLAKFPGILFHKALLNWKSSWSFREIKLEGAQVACIQYCC